MNEEILNNEAKEKELEKLEKIKISLSNIENKKSKFLFCVPDIQNPGASVYEIYFHATVIKKMGYKTIILTEKKEYELPNWIENELLEHEHIAMSDNKIIVSPEDVMVIPEVFSNVMEQTKNLPCIRIGLLQSVDYMLNALVPGTDWKNFGIDTVITTSKTMEEFLKTFYGKNKFNIKTYNPSVPDYFKKSEIPQKPVISIVGRNPNEISKLVKLFYNRYPQYSWITFDPMLTKSKPPQTMRRKDFAERLRGNFAAVWVDRISSWGTFPLECMKSGVIPICLKPDITPEYILERDENNLVKKVIENSGIWTDNFYDIPILIGEVLIKFLDDTIGDDIYSTMEGVVSNYTPDKSEKSLTDIYTEIMETRKSVFKKAIEPEYDKVTDRETE